MQIEEEQKSVEFQAMNLIKTLNNDVGFLLNEIQGE